MHLPDAPTSEVLQAALNCASQRGWYVFPCHPDTKRPVVEHGLKDATRDEQTIRQWWKRWPGAMIGVRTGELSGIWVIDLDIGEGVDGISALARLEETKG